MKIGFSGTGRMGVAMCLHLIDNKHSLTVWNRTTRKTKPVVMPVQPASEALLRCSRRMTSSSTSSSTIKPPRPSTAAVTAFCQPI